MAEIQAAQPPNLNLNVNLRARDRNRDRRNGRNAVNVVIPANPNPHNNPPSVVSNARNRNSNSNSSTSSSGSESGQVMKTFQSYLRCVDPAPSGGAPLSRRTYSCVHCRAQLADHEDLISKSFQGSQGRAYLFNQVINIGCGQPEERVLLTGLHAVCDIYCESCRTTLGWKYERAFESSQKYKEGKYIIEVAHMLKENNWCYGLEN